MNIYIEDEDPFNIMNIYIEDEDPFNIMYFN